MSTIQNQNHPAGPYLIIMFLIALAVVMLGMLSCKTVKIDHKTGDKNPSWNTVHMNKIHHRAWFAGNDTIRPAGFHPIELTTKK